MGFTGCQGRGGYIRFRGPLEARYPGSDCYARLRGPATPMGCEDTYTSFDSIINKCFIERPSGVGDRTDQWGFFTAISTCPGRWNKRDTSVYPEVADLVGSITAEEEEKDIVNDLMDDETGRFTKDTQWHFPYSQAESRTVCQLAEKYPELKEKYGC
jgi:hypothetical protein